ncbi:DUF3157 family protein [Riemerella columbina]|uniref:DUF3157 family protein n=1 Tax=Riemerella columbina TaxID=103810 RepID=UPI00038243FF|nr:DUF3157 family protein [Riemerella columbina]
MKTKLFLLMMFIIPLLGFSQKKIETVKLSNGNTVTLFDDNTWKYETTDVQVYGFSSSISKSNSGYTNKSYSNNKSLPAKTKNRKYKTNSRLKSYSSSSYSGYCGTPTKKGGACSRRVSGGGRCWQHR